jgi:serine/threonine-protein kinase 24/25/MST4
MRLFRRVPSDSSSSGKLGLSTSPDLATFGNENRPPSFAMPAEPSSKEAMLGRRLFTKALDPTLTELHAQTSALAKREALAKLSDAFEYLDSVDPEGAYHLMRNMISAVSQDSKLSHAFLNQQATKTPQDGTPQGTVIIKNAATPSPTKLILSSSNPHLKSHRRRQEVVTPDAGEKERDKEKAALEAKLPGREARPGMEHTKQLSDVLYNRWIDGLRLRWPAV